MPCCITSPSQRREDKYSGDVERKLRTMTKRMDVPSQSRARNNHGFICLMIGSIASRLGIGIQCKIERLHHPLLLSPFAIFPSPNDLSIPLRLQRSLIRDLASCCQSWLPSEALHVSFDPSMVHSSCQPPPSSHVVTFFQSLPYGNDPLRQSSP